MTNHAYANFVVLAQAGIQELGHQSHQYWMPVCTGMTMVGLKQTFLNEKIRDVYLCALCDLCGE